MNRVNRLPQIWNQPWTTLAVLAVLGSMVLTQVHGQYEGLQEFNPPADPESVSGRGLRRRDADRWTWWAGGRKTPSSLCEATGLYFAGPGNGMTVPVGAEIVRLEGHSILPGLLDSHFHIGSGADMYKDPAAVFVTRRHHGAGSGSTHRGVSSIA